MATPELSPKLVDDKKPIPVKQHYSLSILPKRPVQQTSSESDQHTFTLF
jgi:hypothetical protein